MFPLLVGFVAATLFGVLAYSVYGLDALVSYPWIDAVFWALIGAGVLVSAANISASGMICRFARLVGTRDLQARLCSPPAPCEGC